MNFAVAVYLLAALTAFGYSAFGNFIDTQCGTEAAVSGEIVSAKNIDGGINIELSGVSPLVRHSARGLDRKKLTSILESNVGNQAKVTYRAGMSCYGGNPLRNGEIYPTSISVGDQLVLSEIEVANTVQHEREKASLAGIACLAFALIKSVNSRQSASAG